MKTAYLGLGSNVGDRWGLLREAVRRLHRGSEILVTRLSSVYETAPVGLTTQPDFLNLVAEVQTTLSARELLVHALAVEADLGRVRRERWGPRTIDIDVLWMQDQVAPGPELALPHPRAAERGFVLLPLAELAPDLTLNGVSVGELAQPHRDQAGLRCAGPLYGAGEAEAR